MQRQREQARAKAKFKMAQGLEYDGAATAFHGYEHLVCEHSRVTAIYIDGSPVQRARAGDDVVIVLDHTPFYAESGGQVGDSGELRNARSRVVVDDTLKIQASVFGHHGRIVEGEVELGDEFDRARRCRAPCQDRAQPQRHAPDAQGAARGAGRARAAEGQPGECRAHALRLCPQRAAEQRADPQGRAAGQCRGAGQRGGEGRGDAHRGGAEGRRDDALRREVRRRGARARHRLQPRAVRRHACAAHRRHRPVHHRRRRRRRGRRAPCRGADRRQLAGLRAGHGKRARRRGRHAACAQARGAGACERAARPGAWPGEGTRRAQGQAGLHAGRRTAGARPSTSVA